MADRIEVQITWDDSQLEKTLEDSEKKIKDFSKEVSKNASITSEIKLSAESLAKLKSQLDKANTLLKDAKKRWDKAAVINIRANIELLKRDISKAGSELTNLKRRWDKELSGLWAIAQKTWKKFNAMTQSIRGTLGALLWLEVWRRILNGILWTAISFESAFAWVRKTVEATEEQFASLESELRTLTTIIPKTFEELAQIAELGWQLWVGIADITKFTETVANIGTATTLSIEEAAVWFAKISWVMKEPIDDLEKMASVVVALGNDSRATENEILEFTRRITWIWKITGFTSKELLAISTAFIWVWVRAEAWGTQVGQALLKIDRAVNKWGKNLQKFATLTGQTVEEFWDSWKSDAWGQFNTFVTALWNAGKDASEILEELINWNNRLQQAFLWVGSDSEELTRLLNLASVAYKESNALQKEAEERYKTTASQLQLQRNQWRLLWDMIGKQVLPFFVTITGFITNSVIPTFIKLRAAIAAQIIDNSTKFLKFRKELVILLDNIKTFWNNTLQIFKNLGTNIWIVFSNIPELAKKGLNVLLGNLTGFVNDAIAILNKIPKVNIQPIEAWKVFKEGFLDEFVPISKGIKEFTKEAGKDFDKLIDINEQAQAQIYFDTEKSLNELEGVRAKSIEKTKKAILKSGEDEREAARKVLDEIKGIEDDKAKLSKNEQRIKNIKELAAAEIKRERESLNNAKETNDKIVEIIAESDAEIERIRLDSFELEKKLNEKRIKLSKESSDEVKNLFKEVLWEIDESIDSLEDYVDELEKVEDAFDELQDSAIKDLRNINDEVKNLNKEISELDTQISLDVSSAEQEKVNKLIERRVDLIKDQKELEEDLVKAAKIKGQSNREEEQAEINKKLVATKKEILEIDKNLTDEQIKRAEAEEDVSKTWKIIRDAEAEKTKIANEWFEARRKLDRQLATLEEKKAIAEAFARSKSLDDQQVFLEKEWENVKAFVKDEEGNIKEITDFKNKEYAVDLINKQASLDFQKEQIITAFSEEKALFQQLKDEELQIEKNLTTLIWKEFVKRNEMLNELLAKARKLKEMMESSGIDTDDSAWDVEEGVNNSNTNNKSVTNNFDIKTEIDLDSTLREVNKQ